MAYINGDLDGELDGELDGDELAGYVGGAPAHHRRRGVFNPELFQQIMPVPETSIAAAGAADISAQPQRGFRPMRIVVPSTIGPNFKVSNISVGQDPQFVSPGVVYCEVMSEVAVGVGLKGTKAHLGNLVTVSVINRDTVNPQVFSATVFGITKDMAA